MLLKIENITKQYSSKIALDNISLNIPKGKIFGLLGPNGAGKTSLIRIITQITKPDKGKILYDNENLKLDHTHQIGYLPEERGLYSGMKVGEQLLFLAEIKGLSKSNAISKIDEWFEKFDIEDWENKKIRELSKGMQQKIQFISTVLHEPKLLICDEPFSGLDPVNTDLIKNEIRKLRDKGVTIIFSTHRMEQVEEICEEIALINNGKIILEGQVDKIKNSFRKKKYLIGYDGELPQDILQEHLVERINDNEVVVSYENFEHPNELLELLMGKVKIHKFQEILPSLNEIFIDQVKGVSHE